MHKLLFLVAGEGEDRDAAGFGAKVRTELLPRLLERSPKGLKLSLSDPSLPRCYSLPARPEPVALVSLWSEAADATPWREAFTEAGLFAHGYRVTESTPRAYQRDWPDGQATPGVCLLTLFRRRAWLSQERFLHRWHQGHSPMALRSHPLWNYIRNVVEEPLGEGAPPWAGIVEEQFREHGDLTDPRRFYGGTLRMIPTALHVLAQTSTFLSLLTIRNHLVVEEWHRTP